MDLIDLEIRASQAKSLKENPIFIELFDTVENAVVSRMKESAIKDKELHSQLVLQLQAIQTTRNTIEREIKRFQSAVTAAEAKERDELQQV